MWPPVCGIFGAVPGEPFHVEVEEGPEVPHRPGVGVVEVPGGRTLPIPPPPAGADQLV